MIQNRHILIHNIYYMLSYAFQTLNRSDDEDMAPEAFENIHNLFAAILSKGRKKARTIRPNTRARNSQLFFWNISVPPF